MTAPVDRSFAIEQIAGVSVSDITASTLAALCRSDIEQGRTAAIVAINPEKIVRANEDPKLMTALAEFDYPIADGMGVVRTSKKRGGVVAERYCGIDAMLDLCALAADTGAGVFLYGAAPGVAENAAGCLRERFAGLNVSGTLDGYTADTQAAAEAIADSDARIVFVALGSPKQEYFICGCKKNAPGRVYLGVGGSFDVISGSKRRAPAIFRRLGLEWLYRGVTEPSRLVRYVKLVKYLTMKK